VAFWRLFYHFVWSTKNRQPLIGADVEASLHNVMAAKATKLGAIVHAVGGVEDHVHLAVSVPPKLSLSDFVSQVKGNSSHFANHELGFPFAWQAEYGVVSFGGKQLDVVVKYVKNQRQHHLDKTTMAFLERTLEKGELPV
jgi:putative transposase